MNPRNENARLAGRALSTASNAKRKLPPDTGTIKRLLANPATALDVLGLRDRAKRQGRGFALLCPWHEERTPSCSVTTGPDGTLRAHCFGCKRTGDVIALGAAVLGLDMLADFPRVLAELAARCGLSASASLPPLRPLPAPTPPPADEVRDLWARCLRLSPADGLWAQLDHRGIDPAAVLAADLARVLPVGLLPRWCCGWQASEHRLILPLYDAAGNLASVHGRSLTTATQTQPKGRFPSGHRASGLVMADAVACDLLATGCGPWWTGEVHISEGATDFLTLASRWGDAAERLPATLGICSGTWSAELAARIPPSAVVRILTHPDEAGQRYAAQIEQTLGHCCSVVQPRSHTEGSRRDG